MPNRPAVVLIDDGELEDLVGTLRELDAEPVRVPGVEADGEWLWPSRLLVASARRGLALGPFTSRDKRGCTTIAVAEDDSRTVQALARRMGFDYLVRRPVHPEALRLLLLRALYGDRERRLEPRLPIGYAVTWRARLRAHDATVAEISPGGCRLLTARRLSPGSRLSVHIPRALAGGLGLRLPGRAVRCERRAATQGAPWLLGVAFENLSERARRRLDDLLDRYAIGPPRLPNAGALSGAQAAARPRAQAEDLVEVTAPAPQPACEIAVEAEPELAAMDRPTLAEPVDLSEVNESAAAELPVLAEVGSPTLVMPPDLPEVDEPTVTDAEDTVPDMEPLLAVDSPAQPEAADGSQAGEPWGSPGPGSASQSERRRPRAVFSQEVVALDDRADSVLHVLVGRDLSAGGIRIEPHPVLAVGDQLRLAIYDASAKEPFIVQARVERDDDGAGLGLRFIGVEPEVSAQIEAVVDSLPAVEALRPAEGEPQGVVMAEILESDESERR